jgi:hypothetical protein
MSLVYGGSKATTGPTIAGCALQGADELVVAFDETLLRDDEVQVQDYNRTAGFELSAFQVLTNASMFCSQPMLRCKVCPIGGRYGSVCDGVPNGTRLEHCGSVVQEWYCPDGLGPEAIRPPQAPTLSAGLGGVPPHNPYENPPNWVTVNITRKSKTEVSIDLSSLNGVAPAAVRYAWGNTKDSCCANAGDKLIGISKPCSAKACPIMSSSGLPANPFFSFIVDGRCKCLEPQQCNGVSGSMTV